jgi:hypothetical protein
MVPLLSCLPLVSNRIYQIFSSLQINDLASIGFNYIFTFALILDLISVVIISLSSFSHFWTLRDEYDFKSKEMSIPIFGFLWVVFSLLWRFPFYLEGGFDLGFNEQGFLDLEANQFYNGLLNNQVMLFFQLFGAICLLFFLYFQEKYFEPINKIKSNDTGKDIEIGVGRATVLGVLNVISVLSILFGSNITPNSQESMDIYGVRSNGIFFLIGIIFKIIIIPLLTLWVCWKIIALGRFSASKIAEITTANKKSELFTTE